MKKTAACCTSTACCRKKTWEEKNCEVGFWFCSRGRVNKKTRHFRPLYFVRQTFPSSPPPPPKKEKISTHNTHNTHYTPKPKRHQKTKPSATCGTQTIGDATRDDRFQATGGSISGPQGGSSSQKVRHTSTTSLLIVRCNLCLLLLPIKNVFPLVAAQICLLLNLTPDAAQFFSDTD